MTQRIWMGLLVGLLCSGSALAGSYGSSVRRATRSAEVYNFNTVRAEVVWSATHLTPTFRAARVAREAKLRKLDTVTVASALPGIWQQSGSNFFVTLFAPRDTNGDLLGGNPLWMLELQDEAGRSSAPAEITAVTPSALDRALFPKLTPWSRAYYVHFAAAVGDRFTLTLRGPTVASTLTWK